MKTPTGGEKLLMALIWHRHSAHRSHSIGHATVAILAAASRFFFFFIFVALMTIKSPYPPAPPALLPCTRQRYRARGINKQKNRFFFVVCVCLFRWHVTNAWCRCDKRATFTAAGGDGNRQKKENYFSLFLASILYQNDVVVLLTIIFIFIRGVSIF